MARDGEIIFSKFIIQCEILLVAFTNKCHQFMQQKADFLVVCVCVSFIIVQHYFSLNIKNQILKTQSFRLQTRSIALLKSMSVWSNFGQTMIQSPTQITKCTPACLQALKYNILNHYFLKLSQDLVSCSLSHAHQISLNVLATSHK